MAYTIRTDDDIVIEGIPDDVAPDSDVLKQRVAAIRAERQAQPAPTPIETPAPVAAEPEIQDGPTLGQIGAGLATEIAISTAGQATGAALAPWTLGISYPVASFAGGVGGSVAAQKIEGRDNVSVGRALVAGLINIIPGSQTARGGVKAGAAIAREAGKGAAIGASEATATAIIDEKRPPTLAELAGYAGAGTVFGGLMGATFKGGERLWRKIKNKTPEQVDAMVVAGQITPDELTPVVNQADAITASNALKGEAEAIQLANAVKPQADIVNSPSAIVVGRGEGLRRFISAVAPSRAIGSAANDAVIGYKNNVAAAREIGSRLGDKIDREIAKQANPQESQALVNAYLDGATNELPESLGVIRTDLELAREKILELQSKLVANIESGISIDPGKRLEIIKESMQRGNYLTREFRFFTDKRYNPTNEQRKAVIDEIANESVIMGQQAGEPIDRATAVARAEEYLKGLDNKKLTEVESYNWLPSSIDGILKRKKDLGPALLDYLGEIKQPGERVSGTISRLGRAVYRDTADNEIGSLLEKAGLASRQKTDPQLLELQLRKNKPEGSGLYVAPHVQDAINELYIGGGEEQAKNLAYRAMQDIWETGVSASKAAKVLLNPPSYAVQFYGNTANLAAQGINPFGNGFSRAVRLAFSEFGPVERLAKEPAARRALLQDINDMTKYGIKSANILDSDIRSGLEGGIFGKGLQKALDPFSKVYTVPDTVGRYVSWKHHQKMVRSIFPEADTETVKQFAASLTNDTYQNYGRLSNAIKKLSRVGVIPQFASFTMEFARNQYHQGRIIREMLNGTLGQGQKGLGPANVRQMQIDGAKRLASLLGVYGSTYAAVKMFNRENGVDQETENALRDVAIPDYDQSRLLGISYNPETMTGKYANLSYVVPQAVGLSALEAGINGSDVSSVSDIITQELVGEGSFFARSIYATLLGTNPRTGKPITFETEKYKQAKDLAEFAIKDAFAPSISREITKFGQASRGQGELKVPDVIGRQFGARFNPLNVPDNARFKFSDLAERMNLASSAYTSARENKNLSPAEIEAQYEKSNAARKDAMQVAIRHVGSLRTLGMDDSQIVEIMKKGDIGSKDILAAFDGEIADMPKVKRVTPSDYWSENVSMLSRKEQAKAIRVLAGNRDTAQLAKQLNDIYMQDMRNESRGIQQKDRLILALGVNDGERANYVYRQMNQTQNPDAFLREMQKKGIANETVTQQIRMLQRAAEQASPAR
jgi:hypothetical protein